MFNSKEYAWNDLKILMLGREVSGIRDVKYKTTQEKEVVYGRGPNPRSIQKGNKSYEGSVMLLQSEIEALIEASGVGNDITDIGAFDIVVTYETSAGVIITDIIKNAEITEFEKGLEQNAKFMEVELPFIALNVEYNV